MAVVLEVALTGCPYHDMSTLASHPLVEGGQNAGDRLVRPDRITRHDRGPADRPVSDHAAGKEVKYLVGAQDERRDRVSTLTPYDRACGLVLDLLAGRMVAAVEQP